MDEKKTNINCLSCIYDDHHLNPYKIGASKNWNLASYNKKIRKINENRLKYTHFWEELEYWLVNMPTHFKLKERMLEYE